MYRSIRAALRTGDLVGFSGKGLASSIIKLSGKWSHVGIIYRLEDRVFLWESTTLSNLKDISSGTRKEGVQLVNLSQRIASYDGEICIRQILGNREKVGLDNLDAFYNVVHDRPYEKNTWELICAALDGPWGIGQNQEDFSSLFCSELVAESLQRLGMLSDYEPANEFTPSDFFTPNDLQLKSGYVWGVEQMIKGKL